MRGAIAGASPALVAALALGLMACGGGAGEEATPTTPASPTSPTTASPQPATSAPTAGPPEELGYQLVPVLEQADFAGMLGFEMIPGTEDQAVVLLQTGQVWRISLTDPALVEPYADLSERLVQDPQFEEGLLGLAFPPDFPSDNRVFVHYSAGPPRRNVLSWFPVTGEALELSDEHVVLEVPQPYENHNGGQIRFGPDGMLYVSLGDGGFGGDPEGNAQNLGTRLGSVLRLDVSGQEGYEVPPDNPFIDTAGARGEIFAHGFRNPWRFSFDRETGELWSGDVGENTWEEVNRVVAGGNYGWDIMEGFECFGAPSCDMTGLTPPRAVYPNDDANCAVIGGYVYRGSAMPELDGWYVYGDNCSGSIWAVNTTDERPPVLLAETDLSITSFGELPDGELLAITFDNAVYRLERAP